ncbi:MAG: hypothetical protein SGI88_18775 [Candidatus Hydrogenedentes bacterium]|nr:hypothetical protein [Candidatus Hydrogenedentota bacterium]
MRIMARMGVLAIVISFGAAPLAWAGEGKKEGRKDKQEAASAAPAGDAAAKEPKADKADKPDKADKVEKKPDGTKASAGKTLSEAEEKEVGGDENELNILARELALSDAQKSEVGKEFERYRAKQLELNASPEKSPNEKLLKGPQRRALRAGLDKWIKGHVSPGQAQKYEAYANKRKKELYDEQVNNRVAKMAESLKLGGNEQSRLRTVYDTNLRDVQNAADALYAAPADKKPELEEQLEEKRAKMKSTVEGLLKPEQLETYRKLEDS